jgi:hypothetical protein
MAPEGPVQEEASSSPGVYPLQRRDLQSIGKVKNDTKRLNTVLNSILINVFSQSLELFIYVPIYLFIHFRVQMCGLKAS